MPIKELELVDYIKDAMSMVKRPLTILDIIDRIEILGYEFSSPYKMSIVKIILNSHPKIFNRDGKGFVLNATEICERGNVNATPKD
jgi:hypothetical protein